MKLKCVGTGSSGNCYILTNGKGHRLMLDAGVYRAHIAKGLEFNVKNIDGCLISHHHTDHCRSAKYLEQIGIRVVHAYEHEERKTFKLGDFFVQTFPLPHGKTPNRGFIIDVDGQRILYMTDYEYCPFNFRKMKINHMLIECNYSMDMLNRDYNNADHVLTGHAELETVKEFVRVNSTDALRSVILCHLSRSNGSDDRFADEVSKMARNANLSVAEAWKEYTLEV